MEKAFGYLRVSGKGQLDGDGFDRQRKSIEDYAAANGFEIVHIYEEEGVSGTLADRPALADMIISLEQNGHGVKTVIIERIDRLARDLMVQETILSEMNKGGVSVLSATDGDLLDDDPTRKLVRQVLGAIAEYDKEMTVQKLRAARERKRMKNGKCEGRKSYAEINPNIIKEINRLKRKRKGRKNRTSKEIARCLNEAGFVSATGGEFNGRTVENIIYNQKRRVGATCGKSGTGAGAL